MSTQEKLQQALTALQPINQEIIQTVLQALQQQLTLAEETPLDTAKLAGERRQVTVMFADISGFTAMSEKLDPEEVRNTINNCFDRLGAVIDRYDGFIDKFIGDEIMALFGAPIAHENDPERALRAALDMMEALTQFNHDYADRLPKPLALHFGINTGLVIAGGIGTSQRQDYSVMGDTVNLAARLEGLSESGEILVGSATHRLTAPMFEFEPLKPVKVKGKEKPVQVYRLLSVKHGVAGQVRGIEGLYSPMVGRQEEFEALRQLIVQHKQGQGGVVSVLGEAGLGKSRLTVEIRMLCNSLEPPTLWVKGHALSYAENARYFIAKAVLRDILGVTPNLSAIEVGTRLQESLQSILPTQHETLYPYLANLLELPLEHETAHQLGYLDGQVLQQRITEAIQTYLSAVAAHNPLVMIWDDLHWADPSSLALLENLLPLTKRSPILFILVYRPMQQRPEWKLHDRVNHIIGDTHICLKLSPITAKESHQLINNLLGEFCLSVEIRQKIVDKSEGNPFFIEEVIRGLINNGTISRTAEGQQWQVIGNVDEITIPDSLQGVIMARIDSLSPEAKRVLQIASVLGRTFNQQVLQQVVDNVLAE